MENYYKKLGLKPVINASGRMTIVGVATLSAKVLAAMRVAGQNYVLMDDLIEKSGAKVAHLLGSEKAMIVASASVGIALAVASLIHKGNQLFIQKPLDAIVKYKAANQVILPKGHNIDYGVPIETVVQSAGGQIVEAGWANKCARIDIENHINEHTVAIMYVKSHHCVQKSMLSLEDIISVAKKHQLPLIVDAAAEEDLQKYTTNKGIDIVIFSGAKAIEGPTSGIIAYKQKYDAWIKAENYGIGRNMKTSKETIIGQLVALETYLTNEKFINLDLLNNLVAELNKIDGFQAEIVKEESRNIARAKLVVNHRDFSAKDIVRKLENGNATIITRNHRVNEQIIYFDPRPLKDEDYEEIISRIKQIRKDLNGKLD